MDDLAVDALVSRARRAVAVAVATVSQAEVVTAASRLASDRSELVRRCAWCGRLALGHWTPEEHAPEFLTARLQERATHGICPDCLSRLERQLDQLSPFVGS